MYFLLEDFSQRKTVTIDYLTKGVQSESSFFGMGPGPGTECSATETLHHCEGCFLIISIFLTAGLLSSSPIDDM